MEERWEEVITAALWFLEGREALSDRQVLPWEQHPIILLDTLPFLSLEYPPNVCARGGEFTPTWVKHYEFKWLHTFKIHKHLKLQTESVKQVSVVVLE